MSWIKNKVLRSFKAQKLKEVSTLFYILTVALLTSFVFHLYSQNFIFFSKNIHPSLEKAYKEIHHPQTKVTQAEALDFIAEVASQPEAYTQDESLRALNLLSGVVFHFGIRKQGQDALRKIYENIFITKNETLRIRSILYLEWIALKWTMENKVYRENRSLPSVFNKNLSLDQDTKTDNLALKSTEYLLGLVFMNKPFVISDKQRAMILTGLNTISKQSENSEARVFAMNQLFNLAFLRNRQEL